MKTIATAVTFMTFQFVKAVAWTIVALWILGAIG